MRKRKKFLSGVLISLAVIAGLGYQFGPATVRAVRDATMRSELKSDPRTKDIFKDLGIAEEYLAEHPDDPQGLISTGLVWKTFGEATGERRYFERSRQEFERAAALFGDKNTTVLLNAANANRHLGNYEASERYLNKAIAVNPALSEPYLGLIELYRYNLKRGDREIINTYREAIDKVFQNVSVVHSLAFYLKDMQRYKDALPYFQLLAKSFPDDPQYVWEIKFMNESVAAGEDKSTGTGTPALVK